MAPHPVDIAVSLLAQQQFGNFSVRQAKAAGADDALIWRRRRAGRWLVRAPAVLGLPGYPPSDRSDLWVALLDAGVGAMASDNSGAALQGLDGFFIRPLSILVPHGAHHRNLMAVVHQTRRMPTPVLRHGIPTTPLVRVLLDVAATTPPIRLGRAIDQAVVEFGASIDAVHRGWEWMHATRRRGATNLGVALEGRTHGYVPTRSELERLLDAIISTLPCPPPRREVNLPTHPTEPHRVDRVFDVRPLIVEGDGRLWHARMAAMENDKRRDRRALRLGYPTVRYSWSDLTTDASEVRAELMDLLGLSHPVRRSG